MWAIATAKGSGPDENAHSMDDTQLLRYSRHILLPEFGLEAQEKLAAAHALVIGAGGLGAPVAQFLVAAGLGTLTLCDPDVVDLTNLQRQILYATPDIGAAKGCRRGSGLMHSRRWLAAPTSFSTAATISRRDTR